MGKYYYSAKGNRVWGKPLWSSIGRFAWPALTSPKEDEYNGKKTLRYGVTCCLDATDPKTDVFLDALDQMVNEKKEGLFDEYNSRQKGAKLAPLDTLIKDGNGFSAEKYPYYQGKLVLLARNPDVIVCIGPKGKTDKIDASTILGGMLGRILITPHIGPPGLSFRCEAVQLWKDDGVRFGGGVRSLDEFMEAIDGEESEELGEDVIPEELIPAPPEAEEVATPKRGRPPAGPAQALKPSPVTATELRARTAASVKGAPNIPGVKVVTTGKGKGLALDNL